MTPALHTLLGGAIALCSWLIAGALLGTLHFLSLRGNVRMLAHGAGPWAIAFQLARLALTALALIVIARCAGAAALLAAAIGLLLARTAIVRREAGA
ncbi:MAG TPA: ATP synthase subunit I [Xanthobacteraceae bacterium]|nr:ATP synthase subunit I [Xanthobacteraceae bacterium]